MNKNYSELLYLIYAKKKICSLLYLIVGFSCALGVCIHDKVNQLLQRNWEVLSPDLLIILFILIYFIKINNLFIFHTYVYFSIFL